MKTPTPIRVDVGLLCPHQVAIRSTYCHECEYERYQWERDREQGVHVTHTALLNSYAPGPRSDRRSPAQWTRDAAWSFFGAALTLIAWVVLALAIVTLVRGCR